MPLPVAVAVLCMGVALLPPVVFHHIEHGSMAASGIWVAASGCLMMLFGFSTLVVHLVSRQSMRMPSGVRLAIGANILFLAFFSLEFSDLMVRRGGKLYYWSNFLFVPSAVLFWGLLTARRWAWWASRGIAALGVALFLGFTLLIPFGSIQREGVPAPWTVRAYMICLSLAFAAVLCFAFRAIGHPETRRHFSLSA